MLEIVKKRQVKKEIGWKGFFSRTNWDAIQAHGVWYAGGIESIDKKCNLSEKPPRQILMGILKKEKGLAFEVFEGHTKILGYVFLHDNQIKKIKIQNTEMYQKSMGALGQGLVGGLLFGGVGLLLGAAKGISDSSGGKEQTTWIMTIEYEGDTDSNAIGIEISPKRKEQYVNFLKHNYPNISEFDTEYEKGSDESTEKIESTVDIPEQIKKLSDLKDQGILTEEEFQSNKMNLLDKM
tara:strand:+ start:192 stop:902 length:711 start_codon:yes stop_codon:yes gene_type:complete